MASITINSVKKPVITSTEVTGEEKLLTINKQGKPVTVSVNQILDKVDDNVADRVEEQVMNQIMDNVDDKIDDRIDEAIDNVSNLKWNDV